MRKFDMGEKYPEREGGEKRLVLSQADRLHTLAEKKRGKKTKTVVDIYCGAFRGSLKIALKIQKIRWTRGLSIK
jgi:hypothetical protein